MQASGEQFVSAQNSMSVISMSRGLLAPASGELRSEVAIVAGIAQATVGAASGIVPVGRGRRDELKRGGLACRGRARVPLALP